MAALTGPYPDPKQIATGGRGPDGNRHLTTEGYEGHLSGDTPRVSPISGQTWLQVWGGPHKSWTLSW
jgi:hypothetical protein